MKIPLLWSTEDELSSMEWQSKWLVEMFCCFHWMKSLEDVGPCPSEPDFLFGDSTRRSWKNCLRRSWMHQVKSWSSSTCSLIRTWASLVPPPYWVKYCMSGPWICCCGWTTTFWTRSSLIWGRGQSIGLMSSIKSIFLEEQLYVLSGFLTVQGSWWSAILMMFLTLSNGFLNVAMIPLLKWLCGKGDGKWNLDLWQCRKSNTTLHHTWEAWWDLDCLDLLLGHICHSQLEHVGRLPQPAWCNDHQGGDRVHWASRLPLHLTQ